MRVNIYIQEVCLELLTDDVFGCGDFYIISFIHLSLLSSLPVSVGG